MSVPGFTADIAAKDSDDIRSGERMPARYQISIPGLAASEYRLGDLLSRTASYVGIAPCDGCRQRSQTLNSWISFVRK